MKALIDISDDDQFWSAAARKHLLTLKEAEECFSIPLQTLYKWSSQGKMPKYKIGRRVYVNPDEFIEWLDDFHVDGIW